MFKDAIPPSAIGLFLSLSLLVPSAALSASNSEFEQFDLNSDQQLSTSEFVGSRYTITDFKSADIDKNQQISVTEFATFKTSLSELQQRQKSGPNPPRG